MEMAMGPSDVVVAGTNKDAGEGETRVVVLAERLNVLSRSPCRAQR